MISPKIERKIITTDLVKAVMFTGDRKYFDIFIFDYKENLLQTAVNQKDGHITVHDLISSWEEELREEEGM